MSAPVTDLPPSISSSGHTDGLGRRLLTFDRETGAMRERLYLRPELSAFEAPLQRRVQFLSTFDDERFARPYSVQRDPVTGELTVVAEFIAGSRLSDLIETAQEAATVPGVDVALGFLLEVLPALSTFHSVLSISHGLIDPTRTVVTPAGQVVLLDTSFGEVVERLTLSPARLWVELGVAARESGGRVPFDLAADITQVAMSAVTLVLGRRLRVEEFPQALSSTLMEVVDVAQIRGSSTFAAGLQQILQRCLPLAGHLPYATADEALTELRDLVQRNIGAEVCRQGLIEFVEQMDAACEPLRNDVHTSAGEPATAVRITESLPMDLTATLNLLTDDQAALVMQIAIVEPERQSPGPSFSEEQEISLDDLVSAGAGDLSAPEVADQVAQSAGAAPAAVGVQAETGLVASPATLHEDPPPVPADRGTEPAEVAAAPAQEASVDLREGAASTTAPTADAAGPLSASALRRKRHHRSARERKDKLRSTRADPNASPPSKQITPPPRTSPWLVSPGKAAAFEPITDPVPAALPVALQEGSGNPASAAGPIPMPVFSPTPAVAPVHPVVPGAPAAEATSARGGQPVPIAPIVPHASRTKRSPPSSTGVRVKSEAPPGYKPPRTGETLSTVPYVPQGPLFGRREPTRFPWKMASVVILVVAVAVVAGRAYLPSRGGAITDAAAPPPAPEPSVVVAPQPESGEIVVRSQPAGVKVLLDGKPVGETPLKLTAVAVGRHVLTFASSSGEVTRAVRVEAGQTVDVDVPVFSGWLAVFAPIVLDVSLNGRSLGTTEQNRLMLPPGRHKLTLTNLELGYRAVQTVEIEPGEVRSITIEPRGQVNLNAHPWAEVWLDGQKLGDTPLAGLEVGLGVREFVFRHPDHGERRVTATVRAGQPAAVSVDFTRPPLE